LYGCRARAVSRTSSVGQSGFGSPTCRRSRPLGVTIGAMTRGFRSITNVLLFASSLILLATSGSIAQDMPAEYQAVLTELGKRGDYKDAVLKVNIPRPDLSVTIA